MQKYYFYANFLNIECKKRVAVSGFVQQSIYAYRRQSPTHKANAGGGMRRCHSSPQSQANH